MVQRLIANNSSFDSYHTFKIQVGTLRYYLPETLVNDSVRFQLHKCSCQHLVSSKNVYSLNIYVVMIVPFKIM